MYRSTSLFTANVVQAYSARQTAATSQRFARAFDKTKSNLKYLAPFELFRFDLLRHQRRRLVESIYVSRRGMSFTCSCCVAFGFPAPIDFPRLPLPDRTLFFFSKAIYFSDLDSVSAHLPRMHVNGDSTDRESENDGLKHLRVIIFKYVIFKKIITLVDELRFGS